VTDVAQLGLLPHHTALRCLFVVSLQRGVLLKPEHFADFSERDTIGSLQRVMKDVGLESRVLRKARWSRLVDLAHAYPMMALMNDGCWVILVSLVDTTNGKGLSILNPHFEQDGPRVLTPEVFVSEWSGTVVLCKRNQNVTDATKQFGLRWFLPDILRHKRYLRDVAIAATMSSIIGFATPMMFQLLIDKVITHHSVQTLGALLAIFCTLTAFDAVFSYTRQYLMLFVTSKIDAKLASRTFRHLLSLTLYFFEATTAGVLARHLQQTETIRHFLTGRLFQTMLDAIALPITLTILLIYSGRLTLVVLLFTAAIALIIAIMVPISDVILLSAMSFLSRTPSVLVSPGTFLYLAK
jgi:ATP-binding cassette subfamily B protein